MIAIIGTIVGILVGLIAVGTFVYKVFSKLNVLTEGVMGKPEVKDRSGAVIEAGMPSLQARVQNIETRMDESTTESRLIHLEAWRDAHTKQSDELMTKVINHIIKDEQP